MERLIGLVVAVALVATATSLWRARSLLRQTTLHETTVWGAVALATWLAALLSADFCHAISTGEADQLWFAADVLMVSPLISVLGARRPGSRVWSWFVVLPMTIVLFLPAVTAWNHDFGLAPLRLETPMVAGYALVLLMGTGNYVGTRFGVSAILWAAACLMVLLSMSSLASGLTADRLEMHALATLCLSASLWEAARRSRSLSHPEPRGLERTWRDYRDLFGIVWGRRLMDRLNAGLAQEGCRVRLTPSGFRNLDAAGPLQLTDEDCARIDRALRWHLRRFVDPAWIDQRLSPLQ